MRLALTLLASFGPMAAEARLAARHEAALRAGGAIEPAGDVYRVMRLAYPGCFLAMALEGWLRGTPSGFVTAAGVLLFAASKLLKYWAIATLGPRWTFRVLVPPRSSSVVSGPYRFLRHPNYVAVVGELVGFALLAAAPITGTVGTAGFCALIRRRIAVEERALAETAQ